LKALQYFLRVRLHIVIAGQITEKRHVIDVYLGEQRTDIVCEADFLVHRTLPANSIVKNQVGCTSTEDCSFCGRQGLV
jgi:hypothetical protein